MKGRVQLQSIKRHTCTHSLGTWFRLICMSLDYKYPEESNGGNPTWTRIKPGPWKFKTTVLTTFFAQGVAFASWRMICLHYRSDWYTSKKVFNQWIMIWPAYSSPGCYFSFQKQNYSLGHTVLFYTQHLVCEMSPWTWWYWYQKKRNKFNIYSWTCWR